MTRHVRFRPQAEAEVLEVRSWYEGRRRDLGAEFGAAVDNPDAVEVEFVTASGRTQALVTLPPSKVREVRDDDLVAVRPATSRDVSQRFDFPTIGAKSPVSRPSGGRQADPRH